jgi:hypothetical protein
VIYSGLDWSGSPGNEPHDRLLTFAIVHLDGDLLPDLDAQLSEARRRLRLLSSTPFHHVGASLAAHREFYAAIARIPILARVLVIDKTSWDHDYLKRSRGNDRICDGVVDLVCACPDEVVAGQGLFVDLRRKDMAQVRQMRAAMKARLHLDGRRTFENVQPCPDHRIHGGLVQVADMIAGEVREQGGISGPYLRSLGAKVMLV